MREIANTIERDIARALIPKPEKIQEDYWPIYEKFGSYENAESFLLRDKTIVKTEQKYADRRFFDDGVIFQSKKRYMSDVPDDEQVPVLYSIHHCYYDHYPYNADVLELSNETIDAMKEAYRQIRIAEIYATRVDWMMSGDDSEESFRERIKEDLEEFEKKYTTKDWTFSDDNDE